MRPRDIRTDQAPPRVAEALFGVLVPSRYRDEQLGDLREGFLRRVADPGVARRWYRRQVLRSVPGAIRLRLRKRHDPSDQPGMLMETFVQDVRYGLRGLWKAPGFAIVSTLTLALAIGVNTSIFSLVSVIVFADLPMQDVETVAVVRGVNQAMGIDQGSMSEPDYLDMVERAESFQAFSALAGDQWVLTGGDRPLRVEGMRMTAGLTEVWRLPPVLGRAFVEGEDQTGAPPVAMLSHSFWQGQFAGRTDVLGETIHLDGIQHTVVGVMDPRFEFASFSEARVFVPLELERTGGNRATRSLFVAGRLAPGVSQAAATEEVARIGRNLAAEHIKENIGWELRSAPVMESLLNEDSNTILLMLQLTVGMVILIACANVANMLLARATAREREVAVRSALGAGRARLVRQMLTESLVISLAAALLGLGFARGINESMMRISAGTEDVFLMAELDGRVLLFTLLVSLVAPLVFGLLPALRTTVAGPSGALRDGRSGDGGRGGKRARSALVTAQVSLALALMVVASLLTRTVVNLQHRPLGFEPQGLLTVSLDLPETGYPEAEDRRQFYTQVRRAMGGIPGAGRVELLSAIPGVQFGSARSLVVEGREEVEGTAPPAAALVIVSSGYFEVLGLPVQEGRVFGEEDGPESYPVAVVSREVAEQNWPGENPVGRRFSFSSGETEYQIIGVVGDVKSATDSERPAPHVYLTHGQASRAGMYLIMRTGVDPASLTGPIREAVWSVDAGLPVDAIQTVERAQYENDATGFALITLFVTFAVIALAMAGLGIYGVTSYSVSQRKAEIGLRMALGAEARSVRRMVVWQGARLLFAGIGLGLAAAFVLSRLLSNLVFGVSTHDPVTFVGVPLILVGVALLANLVPARRAIRLDPAATLRGE